mgnify:CR=1 FL=1
MHDDLTALQQRLGYRFQDIRLLQRALTHRSFSSDHNERLEFLGDSVLGLAISSWLYHKLADSPEGDLSRARANLVKEGSLYQLALGLGLPELLRLGVDIDELLLPWKVDLCLWHQLDNPALRDALNGAIKAIRADGTYDAIQKKYFSFDIYGK